MLLRSAIIASVLLGLSPAMAAGPVAAPVKALKGRTPAKKKAVPSSKANRDTSPTLTDESLGLADYKISSIKSAQQKNDAPAPAPAPAPEPAAASPSLEPTNKDKVLVPGDGPTRRLSIELNPLGAAVGHFGLNVEYVPFVHHALTASAYYQTFPHYVLERVMPTPAGASPNPAGKVGGELGYRFYSGRRGANGFFIGASGVVQPLAAPRVTPDFKAEVTSFYAYGGAVDVGIQGITDSGFTIGGGIGGMYLAYSAPESAKNPETVKPMKYYEPHFLPRVLLAVGWSF